MACGLTFDGAGSRSLAPPCAARGIVRFCVWQCPLPSLCSPEASNSALPPRRRVWARFPQSVLSGFVPRPLRPAVRVISSFVGRANLTSFCCSFNWISHLVSSFSARPFGWAPCSVCGLCVCWLILHQTPYVRMYECRYGLVSYKEIIK